jgi:hypothetical protein
VVERADGVGGVLSFLSPVGRVRALRCSALPWMVPGLAPGGYRGRGSGRERGQASLLLLGVVAALLAGTLILFAFGQALGARGKHQRAADLAAISAAQVMRRHYDRLFEPAFLPNGLPNPRHLSNSAYVALARAAARRGADRNGLPAARVRVGFPDAGFAPTRVSVSVHGRGEVRVASGRRPDRIDVEARATAELVPGDFGLPDHADGGGYSGPLAYRQGKPMRPDVAPAFDRMAAAARREAGLYVLITSGYRSDAEQARLFAANPDPKWVAPPGQSLHRYGTELDLGPPEAYGWLAANSERFGFIKRYAWEDWHYGLSLARNQSRRRTRIARATRANGDGSVLCRVDRSSWHRPDARPHASRGHLQCSSQLISPTLRTSSRTSRLHVTRPGSSMRCAGRQRPSPLAPLPP